MLLLVAFSALALVLSAIGIYGVISYLTGQRTHEIGVRVALGASSKDVLSMVLGQGMRMTLIGVAIGIAVAFGLTRLITKMIYGVGATDPLTFVGVAVLLSAVALCACYIPALRATRRFSPGCRGAGRLRWRPSCSRGCLGRRFSLV